MKVSLTSEEFAALIDELETYESKNQHVRSRTSDNVYRLTQAPQPTLRCSCLGFRYKRHCWHVDAAVERGEVLSLVARIAYQNRKSQKQTRRLLNIWIERELASTVDAMVNLAFVGAPAFLTPTGETADQISDEIDRFFQEIEEGRS